MPGIAALRSWRSTATRASAGHAEKVSGWAVLVWRLIRSKLLASGLLAIRGIRSLASSVSVAGLRTGPSRAFPKNPPFRLPKSHSRHRTYEGLQHLRAL